MGKVDTDVIMWLVGDDLELPTIAGIPTRPSLAAYAEGRPGLEWRALQDTTNDPIIAKRTTKAYRSWQMSEDYYSGGQMIWLEADARLRELSGGKVSLDDFARKFFGMSDGEWTVNPYDFDEVAKTLEALQPTGDWATFLRDRLDGKKPLTGGIEASGWKLVFKDTPNTAAAARTSTTRSASTCRRTTRSATCAGTAPRSRPASARAWC